MVGDWSIAPEEEKAGMMLGGQAFSRCDGYDGGTLQIRFREVIVSDARRPEPVVTGLNDLPQYAN